VNKNQRNQQVTNMKILLNDIDIAEFDCVTSCRNNETYLKLQQLNRRLNNEYFTTKYALQRRSLEIDNVEEILDYALMEQDIEAINFYQSRKSQLEIILNELNEQFDDIKSNMKTEYAELTEEEFQIFKQVNDWSYLGERNRTDFYKSEQNHLLEI
jgi:hypothetical protein